MVTVKKTKQKQNLNTIISGSAPSASQKTSIICESQSASVRSSSLQIAACLSICVQKPLTLNTGQPMQSKGNQPPVTVSETLPPQPSIALRLHTKFGSEIIHRWEILRMQFSGRNHLYDGGKRMNVYKHGFQG